MKKILILILLVGSGVLSFGQIPPQTIGKPNNTVIVPGGLQPMVQFTLPRYADTTTANTFNLGVDTCGRLIFTYGNGAIWKRICSPLSWVQIGVGGGGSSVWGGITGTLSSQVDLQNALNAKQATLVSGTNLRTVGGNSLLGPTDIPFPNVPAQFAPAVGPYLLLGGTYPNMTFSTDTASMRLWNNLFFYQKSVPNTINLGSIEQFPAFSIMGNNTGSLATPSKLNVNQVMTMLPTLTGNSNGVVQSYGNASPPLNYFLNSGGGWSIPGGSAPAQFTPSVSNFLVLSGTYPNMNFANDTTLVHSVGYYTKLINNKLDTLRFQTDSIGFMSAIAAKQNTLVSGTNIKTIGGITPLGSGDIPFPTTPAQFAPAVGPYLTLAGTYPNMTFALDTNKVHSYPYLMGATNIWTGVNSFINNTPGGYGTIFKNNSITGYGISVQNGSTTLYENFVGKDSLGNPTIHFWGDGTAIFNKSVASPTGSFTNLNAANLYSNNLTVNNTFTTPAINISALRPSGAADTFAVFFDSSGKGLSYGLRGTGSGSSGISQAYADANYYSKTLANVIVNGSLAQVNPFSVIGNNTGSAASPTYVSAAQLNVMLPPFTGQLNGVVPAYGNASPPANYFLNSQGGWAIPAGGGGGAPAITYSTLGQVYSDQFPGSALDNTKYTTQTPGVTLTVGSNRLNANGGNGFFNVGGSQNFIQYIPYFGYDKQLMSFKVTVQAKTAISAFAITSSSPQQQFAGSNPIYIKFNLTNGIDSGRISAGYDTSTINASSGNMSYNVGDQITYNIWRDNWLMKVTAFNATAYAAGRTGYEAKMNFYNSATMNAGGRWRIYFLGGNNDFSNSTVTSQDRINSGWTVLGASMESGSGASSMDNTWVNLFFHGNRTRVNNMSYPGMSIEGYRATNGTYLSPSPLQNSYVLNTPNYIEDLGYNDASLGYSAGVNDTTTIKANLDAIITPLLTRGNRVIMTQIPPRLNPTVPATFEQDVNTMKINYARNHGLQIVDIRTPLIASGFTANTSYLSSDNIHWNDSGQIKINLAMRKAFAGAIDLMAPDSTSNYIRELANSESTDGLSMVMMNANNEWFRAPNQFQKASPIPVVNNAMVTLNATGGGTVFTMNGLLNTFHFIDFNQTGVQLNITNPSNGTTYLFLVSPEQFGAISQWPAGTKWPSNNPPTLTTTNGLFKNDLIGFTWNGTNFLGSYNLNY